MRRIGMVSAASALCISLFPAVASAAVTVGEAGTAGEGTPTATNEMCGTAYVGNWKLGTPPEGAAPVAGLTVTLTLLDSTGKVLDASDTVTDEKGVFCAAGSAAQQTTMLRGGRTRLSIDQAAVDAYNATAEKKITFNKVLGGTEGAKISDLMPITNVAGQNIKGNNVSFLFDGQVDDGPDTTSPFYGGSLGTGSYIGVMDGLLTAVQAGSTGLQDMVGTGGSLDASVIGGTK